MYDNHFHTSTLARNSALMTAAFALTAAGIWALMTIMTGI
jgi:hypothetical protein